MNFGFNIKRACCTAAVGFVTLLTGQIASAAFGDSDLRPYFVKYRLPGETSTWAEYTPNIPVVHVVGGGIEPPPIATLGGFGAPSVLSYAVDRFVSFEVYDPRGDGDRMRFYGAREGPCRVSWTYVPKAPPTQTPISQQIHWYVEQPYIGGHCRANYGTPPPGRWIVQDDLSFADPTRRKAIDGGQYDAAAMNIRRGGQPWITYYWGYRLSLVASEANWDPANLPKVPELAGWPAFPDAKNNFELASLPPPFVEDDVVEYVNQKDFPKQPVGQFFYAVLASDKAALDAVPAWQRTGKSFKSGGYVSACRFYGGKNGGPNTHFYSADDKECAALKTVSTLSYEGQTFAVNMPMPGGNADGTKPCPIDSKPLYRLYNNASAPGKNYVSNHRYVTERADLAAAVAQGWVDEGQVMCVPQ